MEQQFLGSMISIWSFTLEVSAMQSLLISVCPRRALLTSFYRYQCTRCPEEWISSLAWNAQNVPCKNPSNFCRVDCTLCAVQLWVQEVHTRSGSAGEPFLGNSISTLQFPADVCSSQQAAKVRTIYYNNYITCCIYTWLGLSAYLHMLRFTVCASKWQVLFFERLQDQVIILTCMIVVSCITHFTSIQGGQRVYSQSQSMAQQDVGSR